MSKKLKTLDEHKKLWRDNNITTSAEWKRYRDSLPKNDRKLLYKNPVLDNNLCQSTWLEEIYGDGFVTRRTLDDHWLYAHEHGLDKANKWYKDWRKHNLKSNKYYSDPCTAFFIDDYDTFYNKGEQIYNHLKLWLDNDIETRGQWREFFANNSHLKEDGYYYDPCKAFKITYKHFRTMLQSMMPCQLN